MVQTSRTYLYPDAATTIGSAAETFEVSGRFNISFENHTNVRRHSALVGILSVMLLSIAMACLVGCTGLASPTKSSTTPVSPTSAALRIATNALPVGAVQSNYGTALVATGGVPPYSWTQTGGQLPSGLTLNSTTGAIAGVPTGAGSYSFGTKVVDSKADYAATDFSLNVSTIPGPAISGISPSSGSTEGGTFVTIAGTNFSSGATVTFGTLPAQSVRVVSPNEIQAVTPVEVAGKVNVAVQESDGQLASAKSAFTFTAPASTSPSEASAVNADVVVDASQTVSETGGDDLAAAKNIYASASAPESNGGLSVDWNLISSEFTMKRMRNINGLGDCAVNGSGQLSGCTRLDNDLRNMKAANLTPHVVVGQWAPSSIGGNPLQWGASQWAQYDALCYAIVNHVANQFGGTGFSEALFEVENEMDTTMETKDLWLTTTPNVAQGDRSRYAQFDTVYRHWAKAVDAIAKQHTNKKIRIAGPATGFWTAHSGGKLWHNQVIEGFAKDKVRLDVVSLHFYGDASNLAKYSQSIRSTLNANGNSKAEIWLTEWGASDVGEGALGAINGSHVGAAWAVDLLLQALKGTITGGSFLEVRDNHGEDVAGANSSMYLATWHHVEHGVEYPKPIVNTFSMVDRMTGTRKSAAVNPAKSELHALASCDSSSASLIVSNYRYVASFAAKTASDTSRNETVTVAFTNLPFSGAVTVDRYVVDAKTSNLNYWVATGKVPPSVKATQLQKVESFSANSTGGTVSLPARDLGQSAVSLWIVHR